MGEHRVRWVFAVIGPGIWSCWSKGFLTGAPALCAISHIGVQQPGHIPHFPACSMGVRSHSPKPFTSSLRSLRGVNQCREKSLSYSLIRDFYSNKWAWHIIRPPKKPSVRFIGLPFVAYRCTWYVQHEKSPLKVGG